MKLSLILTLFVSCVSGRSPYVQDHDHSYIRTNAVLRQASYDSAENNASFWNTNAKATIQQRLEQTRNNGIAKNVILFMGDGMSIATLAAARIYLGQSNKKTGEETFLSFEKFPFTGLSKTYCVDRQVADSACSATAYLSGVKNNEGTIGVTAAVKLLDCKAMLDKKNHVLSVAYLSQLAGKRTGIVTTTRITHASPAGSYAHVANRDWESDTDVAGDEQDPKKCLDIAQQLVHGETGKNFNVIFGGGKQNFLPSTAQDEEKKPGKRSDNRNLIDEWKKSKNGTQYQYIYNLKGLNDVPENSEYVLGLFDSSHMDYNLDRDVKNKPSLKEMTEKAIKLLSQGDQGFFLFVEGGRIDHAHHDTETRKALNETVEFHKAIEASVNMTNEQDTLILVTSDHSHTMTINGYPVRGNDVLGIGGMGDDKLPYSTLSYANGPSAVNNAPRKDISKDDLTDKDYKYPSFVPLQSETHGGEDVAIFGKGPWAHLIVGVTEQNVIAHIISYASCIGDFEDCSHRSGSDSVINMSIVTILSAMVLLLQKHLLF